MSAYDIYTDAPGLLRAESLNITLTLTRTSDTTARIAWNIPNPIPGCAASSQAYNGMVVTLGTAPASVSTAPVDGTVYTGDSNISPNTFAGDTLGTSKVVGSFYNDKTSVYVDVSGLSPNVGYFASGYPVDITNSYYISGVHAYSVAPTIDATTSTSGSQTVVFNPFSSPIGLPDPTTSTGLLPNQSYTFQIQVGSVPPPQNVVSEIACVTKPPQYTITVAGANAQTYNDLVTEINKQIALLSTTNQGTSPPNTGSIFVNPTSGTVATWNGYSYITSPNVVFQSTAPNAVTANTSFWYNTVSSALSVWNGTAWDSVEYITAPQDPDHPVADQTYWIDGNEVWLWNGTTWCTVPINVQLTDPSVPVVPTAGSYWYNPTQSVLSSWNSATNIWEPQTFITSTYNPNTIPAGSYWYNPFLAQLYQYRMFTSPTLHGEWELQTNVTSSITAPATPAPGAFWYNPNIQALQTWDAIVGQWDSLKVLVYASDPSIRTGCDAWFNPDTNMLMMWDLPSQTWNPCTTLFNRATDPSLATVPTVGSGWLNSATNVLTIWSGICYEPTATTPIVWGSDPVTFMYPGYAWFNPVANQWFIRTSQDVWEQITPTYTLSDPTILTPGFIWYNTSTDTLQQWNGLSWVPILFSLQPVSPPQGTLWYNATNHILEQWNGTGWIPALPKVSVAFDCNGNLAFTDTTTGSLSAIALADGTLFKSLSVASLPYDPVQGTDGVSGEASYAQIGVGTNGDDTARKEIQNQIRYQLGYPSVDVELTPEQLDTAITQAIEVLRSRSSAGYKRGFFFLRIPPEQQKFILSSKSEGMNKIVEVMGVYRLTSAFLSSAHGAGVYGQIILQHLYNMGTFDLLSYHIISEYVNLMEILFAARITFTWNEQTRELFLMHRFPMAENMVAVDAVTERTEQEILADRYLRDWIRRYATAQSRLMLAEIRGKFSSLPGANGQISYNATDLRQSAKDDIAQCLTDIEDYVADRIDEYGSGAQVVYG